MVNFVDFTNQPLITIAFIFESGGMIKSVREGRSPQAF